MNYLNNKYIVLEASEVSSVNFSEVNEDSSSSLRYTLDNSKTFVSFTGSTPSSLSSKTPVSYYYIKSWLETPDFREDITIE